MFESADFNACADELLSEPWGDMAATFRTFLVRRLMVLRVANDELIIDPAVMRQVHEDNPESSRTKEDILATDKASELLRNFFDYCGLTDENLEYVQKLTGWALHRQGAGTVLILVDNPGGDRAEALVLGIANSLGGYASQPSPDLLAGTDTRIRKLRDEAWGKPPRYRLLH